MKRILISLSIFFMFTSGLQAQIFGGWFRGYNNNYYNNGYYRNYQQPQQQQVQQPQQTTQQQSTQSQYKENTWYRWTDGSYRYYQNGQWLTQQQVQQSQQQQSNQQTSQKQATQEKDVDYPYVYNPARVALTNAEKYIISEVNKLRASLRLPMLVVSPSLMNSSRAQTSAMTVRGMIHNLVGRAFAAAENIAGTSSPGYAFNLWRGSSGHYANMTNGSYRYIGVGCFGGYATQQFSWNADVPYKLVTEADIKAEEAKIKAEEEAKIKAEEEAKAQEEAAATEEAPVVEEEAPVVEEEAPAVEEEAPATEEEELPTLIFEDNEETETHESSVPGFKVVCKDGVCELVPVDEEENSESSDENNSEASDADNQE